LLLEESFTLYTREGGEKFDQKSITHKNTKIVPSFMRTAGRKAASTKKEGGICALARARLSISKSRYKGIESSRLLRKKIKGFEKQ
jgi:hypothetical protein